jgi:hypothetical protein
MESRIPIPTDNIYKFYALFGLALFIAAMFMQVTVVQQTNELAFSIGPELKALEIIAKPTPVEVTKRELLERRLEIAKADKAELIELAKILMYVGGSLMVFGFGIWQNSVQSKQDELLDLQIAKAKLELKQARPVKCSRKRT